MPPSQSTQPDREALDLIRSWIEEDLPNYLTFQQWRDIHLPSAEEQEGSPGADPDRDGASNLLEYLTATNPNDPAERFQLGWEQSSGQLTLRFTKTRNRGFELQSTPSLDPPAWAPVDRPENSPFYSPSDLESLFQYIPSDPEQYFRVRVYEP